MRHSRCRGVLVVLGLLLPLACSSPESAGSRSHQPEDPDPVDADRDGFPVGPGGDCDDTDPSVHPGATDVPYDGVDQDCDGADSTDPDGDGFFAPEGGGDDCDDTDPSVHPGAFDVPYDGLDQDCDGADSIDPDGDGFFAPEGGGDDCDDFDATIHVGAAERCGDRVDQDCDGADLRCEDVDADHDGWSVADGDCRDDDPAIHPGVPEVPYDGIDQDCVDGDLVDLDEDGWSGAPAGGTDCDDANAALHPGAHDLCEDGVDSDCTGGDPSCPSATDDADGDGHAATAAGGDDCDDTRASVNPDAPENPNDGVDQNCDGLDRFFAYPVEVAQLPPGSMVHSIYWNGDHYRAIWRNASSYGSTTLDREGRAIGEGIFLETLPGNMVSDLCAMSDGSQALILVEEMPDYPDGERRVTIRPVDAAMVPGPVVELAAQGWTMAGRLRLGPGASFLWDNLGRGTGVRALAPTGEPLSGPLPWLLDGDRLVGLARKPHGGQAVLSHGGPELWGLRVDPRGTALGRETLVRAAGASPYGFGEAFVGGPEADLLVVDDGAGLVAELLDPETGLLLTRTRLTDGAHTRSGGALRALTVGRWFFVLWTERRWPYADAEVGQWIAPGGALAGSPRGTNLPLLSPGPGSFGIVDLATDGVDVLLGWREEFWGPVSTMRVARPGGGR